MKTFGFVDTSLYVISENSVNPAATRVLSSTQASGYCCGALQTMIDWHQKRSSKIWPQNPFSETFVALRRCPSMPPFPATADQRSATPQYPAPPLYQPVVTAGPPTRNSGSPFASLRELFSPAAVIVEFPAVIGRNRRVFFEKAPHSVNEGAGGRPEQ